MQNGVIMNTKMKSFGFVLALTAFAMAQEAAPVAEAAAPAPAFCFFIRNILCIWTCNDYYI